MTTLISPVLTFVFWHLFWILPMGEAVVYRKSKYTETMVITPIRVSVNNQFIRDRKVGHIIIDEETMIRGVAELFRVLFPALDDFPGNLEDSALALILGSEHPEGFIRLNLTAAEAGDFLRTAFFIPDLSFRNHRGIKGIFAPRFIFIVLTTWLTPYRFYASASSFSVTSASVRTVG